MDFHKLYRFSRFSLGEDIVRERGRQTAVNASRMDSSSDTTEYG